MGRGQPFFFAALFLCQQQVRFLLVPIFLPCDARYAWVDVEARNIIAASYQLHKPACTPPSLSFDRARLETLSTVLPRYPAAGARDAVARAIVGALERLMHLFFREKVSTPRVWSPF